MEIKVYSSVASYLVTVTVGLHLEGATPLNIMLLGKGAPPMFRDKRVTPKKSQYEGVLRGY